jgi:small subunit ribosomal protein S3
LGHKVHPTGFRLGVIKDWQSKWYSDIHYAEFVHEDNKLREEIRKKYPEAAISLIEIDRQAKDVTITLYTARPGIVIGRGGQRVDEMRLHLERLIGKKIRLNIQEVRQPEMDAYLVARSVAEQIERRVAYRRAMKQAIFRTIQAGAKGIKVSCAGRLGNAEIARRQTSHQGQVPLHTLRADIDYGFTEAHTTLGRIGVKVWIYKGQVLPEIKVAEVEEKPAEALAEEVLAAEREEKPAEAVAEAVPATETAEKPAEAVAEAVPAAKPEKKPAKTAEKPAEAVAEAAPTAKPGKKPAKTAEKPAEAVAEAAPAAKPEKKPAKTVEKPAEVKAASKTRGTAKKEPEKKAVKATAAKAKEAEKPAPKRRKKAEAAEAEAKETEAAPDIAPDTEEKKEETEDAAA